MPLLDLFATAPESIASLSLGQVISLSGQGELKDNSDCSKEFRHYLRQVEIERLEEFVQECLVAGSKNGFALQDLVNELGRRLGYQVENGRYHGVQGAIGFDGLWHSPGRNTLVVEVKTTDAYRINLDTLATYRDKLAELERIERTDSILIVVGRQDTGDLEAQVRGSKYAWDVRILGVDALIRLCKVKLRTDFETQARIEQLLVPFEYTRLDKIIDITFAAVQETAEEAHPIPAQLEYESDGQDSRNTVVAVTGTQSRSSREEISHAREAMLNAVEKDKGFALIRESQAKYRSTDERSRIVCSVSKVYPDGGMWYAYHPKWNEFLAGGESGFFCLAAVGCKVGFVIPREVLGSMLPKFWSTGDTETDGYWHIVIRSNESKYSLHGRDGQQFDASPYLVEVEP